MTTDASPDILINFVLDQSGSMKRVRIPTIDGVNAFLDEQRKIPGDVRLSLTLFDSTWPDNLPRLITRYVAEPLGEVPPMDITGPNAYKPDGGTPLLDAVAVTIKGTEAWLAKHPEFTGKVITVVLTDGEENTSTEWHLNHPMVEGDDRDLGGLIQWKQDEGWEFIFLGAGGSAWLERAFGHVVADASFFAYTNDAATSHAMYAGVSNAVTRTRTFGGSFVDNSVSSLADVSNNT